MKILPPKAIRRGLDFPYLLEKLYELFSDELLMILFWSLVLVVSRKSGREDWLRAGRL
jgi:hypothetical protein